MTAANVVKFRPRSSVARADETIDPAELPDVYAARYSGDCMVPVIHGRGSIVCTKTEPPAPGDFVCIWRRRGAIPPEAPQGWVKILRLAPPKGVTFPYRVGPGGNGMPAIVVEMLNPESLLVVPCSSILAMHKCLGKQTADKRGWVPFDKKLERYRAINGCTIPQLAAPGRGA